MHQPFCSIIILNYNGETFIEKTIQSVLELDYPKERFEIIIVDNNSRDKSRELIDELIKEKSLFTNHYSLTTLYLDRNLGFSAGNNVGIKKAKGEYIILLNNDCIVDTHWLKELVSVAEKDEKIFAVNPKVYLGNTNKIQNAGIRIFPNGYAQDRGAVPKDKKQEYQEDHGQYNKEKEIDAACAVATLYRKSIVDKIGLLDESFFLYYEDVEISERAKKQGFKIMYAPKAEVHHLHAVSSGEWSPFFLYHSERGRLLHMFLHFPMNIFMKEFIIFSIKAKLRLFVRLFTKPESTNRNWQYIKVVYYFLLRFPYLMTRRK